MDGAVVELDALADADGTGAEDDDLFLAGAVLVDEFPGLVLLVKGGIEVGSLGLKLGGTGIYHLIGSIEPFFGFLPGQCCHGSVQEAHLLGLQVFVLGQFSIGQPVLHFRQLAEFIEEPAVDHGEFEDLIQGNASLDGFVDYKDALVVAVLQQTADLLRVLLRQLGQVHGGQAHFNGTYRLHHGLLEGIANGHHFAGGFHLGAQLAAGVDEFIEGPSGEFHHHIVDGRLEAGKGVAGDGINDFIQGIADGDPGCHLGDGIAGSLGGQGRGTGHTRIDLDDGVLKAVGMQRKLAVAAAFHAQSLNDMDGCCPQHLIFLVGQGQGRCHHDGVSCMDAHRVDVLHGAHGDGVVLAVPDDFELDFLPPCYALLHQDLSDGRQTQAVDADLA